jgi:transposase
VLAGIDTHKDTLAVAVIDDAGRPVVVTQLANTEAGFDTLERRVEIRVPLEPTRRDWPRLLGELSRQLDDGRVYDRDLLGLGRALEPLLQSYRWRARRTGAPDVR